LCPGLPSPTIGEEAVTLYFPEGALDCPYNESNLPVMTLCSPTELKADVHALNVCLIQENNHNLKASQKELLKWHWKFGHLDLASTQQILRSGACGTNPLIKAAGSLSLSELRPLCGSCQFGKSRKRRSKVDRVGKDGESTPPTPSPPKEKVLSREATLPGEKISMDHFIVSTPGRLFSSRGREAADRAYKGGVIFVDHATGFVFVVPVVNFTAGEALRAKQEFEAELSSFGVTVLHYHTDNGVFTASQFQDELATLGQNITYSGVGAHHQNAVAERAIGTVVAMAWTMMLHAKMRWPTAVNVKLWPMAMKHAQHLLNHIPRNNVCPMDLILRTTVPRSILRNLHVWGCPSYVLEPKLQDGHKIPKFDPRARRALHLGLSPRHASTAPLVLNLDTGNVSPQFHVVFDDWFSTVDSSEQSSTDNLDDAQWTQLFMDERFVTYFDGEDPVELDDEWLSEQERLEKYERAAARVESNKPPGAPIPPSDLPKESSKPVVETVPPPIVAPTTVEFPAVKQAPPTAAVPPVPTTRTGPVRKQREHKPKASPRSTRNNPVGMKLRSGAVKGLLNTLVCFTAYLANEPLMALAQDAVGRPAAYAALAGFDAATTTFDSVDYFSYQAATAPKNKSKAGVDPDYPTYWQAMSSPDAAEWKEAMSKEIQTLIDLKSWVLVPKSQVLKQGHKVIKSTWAFRQKRNPDGTPTKKKARFCVRGNHMSRLAKEGGMDPFETYSPVVQWSSVRLMLILTIIHGLETRQVDYVNAFAQAELTKDVFIDMPLGFQHANDEECVLWLKKSLYGMTDAPLMFFELLKSNLEAIGFKQQKNHDPCLFFHKDAICLSWVDDCLWMGRDGKALDELIRRMKDERGMDLKVESYDVSAFLGIQFTRKGHSIELKQDGLLNKILEDCGMLDCNSISTPADATTLGKDTTGAPFNESWNYRSVVGKLLYLAGNSRPDIAFAVHQVARFSHDPRQSHAVAIKRICRYLQGTKDRGLVMRPTGEWKIDCWVDADFCGLWGSEDPEDPVVAKSRTGYIITLAGCPLMWVSKLQSEVSVSTMMAEYVALSTAMRDMLPLKRLVKEVSKVIAGKDNVVAMMKSDVWEDNNGCITVAKAPRITPQSKFFAVKYHFFREHICTDDHPEREINLEKIDTNSQLGDIFTKGLVEAKFTPLRDLLMGWDLPMEAPAKARLHDGISERIPIREGVSERAVVSTSVGQSAILSVTQCSVHDYLENCPPGISPKECGISPKDMAQGPRKMAQGPRPAPQGNTQEGTRPKDEARVPIHGSLRP